MSLSKKSLFAPPSGEHSADIILGVTLLTLIVGEIARLCISFHFQNVLFLQVSVFMYNTDDLQWFSFHIGSLILTLCQDIFGGTVQTQRHFSKKIHVVKITKSSHY